MLRRPRIVFCDLDDTFLATDKTLIERNMEMLDELARRGIPFVPCTGRGLNGVLYHKELASHPAVRYAITSSGSVVYDMAERAPIHANVVGHERALELYERVRDLDATFDVFADGLVYAERFRYERLPGYGIEAPMTAHMLRSRTPVDISVPEIISKAAMVERIGLYTHMGPEGDAARSRAYDAVASVSDLRWTSAHPAGMEIVDERCSKGEALTWLCGHLGIDVEDSVGFGDSGNDLEMIEAAGLGVVMANGMEEPKRAADMIAPANDEAGVAVVLGELLGMPTA